MRSLLRLVLSRAAPDPERVTFWHVLAWVLATGLLATAAGRVAGWWS